MISPYPMHGTKRGICANCHNETIGMIAKAMGMEKVPDHLLETDRVDVKRPKMRGKHMVVQKSQAQILMEQRDRNLQSKGRYY
jgi:hypothetical protein